MGAWHRKHSNKCFLFLCLRGVPSAIDRFLTHNFGFERRSTPCPLEREANAYSCRQLALIGQVAKNS
jgi:hypothetical protein